MNLSPLSPAPVLDEYKATLLQELLPHPPNKKNRIFIWMKVFGISLLAIASFALYIIYMENFWADALLLITGACLVISVYQSTKLTGTDNHNAKRIQLHRFVDSFIKERGIPRILPEINQAAWFEVQDTYNSHLSAPNLSAEAHHAAQNLFNCLDYLYQMTEELIDAEVKSLLTFAQQQHQDVVTALLEAYGHNKTFQNVPKRQKVKECCDKFKDSANAFMTLFKPQGELPFPERTKRQEELAKLNNIKH